MESNFKRDGWNFQQVHYFTNKALMNNVAKLSTFEARLCAREKFHMCTLKIKNLKDWNVSVFSLILMWQLLNILQEITVNGNPDSYPHGKQS